MANDKNERGHLIGTGITQASIMSIKEAPFNNSKPRTPFRRLLDKTGALIEKFGSFLENVETALDAQFPPPIDIRTVQTPDNSPPLTQGTEEESKTAYKYE